ncbi:integral membrane single C2 domain-containing protein [Thecamonas trahens ATCC 50062]|uniref:Integral membrane single C2 domain-containing protein n=1 Tax=Thecamonas trahens ATCC 50062 TaxID=461836 RepID=A0A0L0D7F2_THETB|nr:integral membrane single C2 domain-containing protein [Thecamonas trahens ATCC 50062]KNC48284.1 integral membrane single C2 domain-containing protein [Thecamonas trahens ATCC 50062]|eukprot:XP_013758851.1 integral membrane single C2 domain-containing protein [Thecamonas trahens ATCC 50062]
MNTDLAHSPKVGACLVVVAFVLGRWIESSTAWLWLVVLVGGSLAWLARSGQLAGERALQRQAASLMDLKFEESRLESVEWLNVVLQRIFNVSHIAFDEYMRETLDPWLEYYKPPGCSEFRFSRFELGKRAPYIKSVRVHRCSADCHDAVAEFDTFQLDLDLEYRGGGVSVASAKMGLLKIPISIKDLSIVGKVRLIITIDTENYVRICHVSFLGKPDIDVTIKPLKGVDLLGVPALSGWLRSLITNGVADMMSWPKRYTYDVADWAVPTPDELVRKRLVVTIRGGRALQGVDSSGTSDPFVVLRLGAEGEQHKTRVIQSALGPVWNESFVFYITDVRPLSLFLEVYDEDRLLKNTLLGTATVGLQAEVDTYRVKKSVSVAAKADLASLGTTSVPADSMTLDDASALPVGSDPGLASNHKGKAEAESEAYVAEAAASELGPVKPAEPVLEVTKWIPLEQAGSGEIQISLNMEVCLAEVAQPGVLSVRLIKGDSIATTKSLILGKKPTCNPYVVFRVGDEVHSSAVKKKTSDPVWEETFHIAVDDVATQQLFIMVNEKETIGRDKPLGDAVINIATIVSELQGQHWISLHNTESGRLHLDMTFTPHTGASAGLATNDEAGASGSTPGASGTSAVEVLGTHSTSEVGSGFSKHGWLDRRSDIRHVWAPRWVTLSADGRVLYYFVDEQNPEAPAFNKAKGQVLLKGWACGDVICRHRYSENVLLVGGDG